ncbi:hypothetical protein ACFQ0M_40710 [Kitasatospora aburaviensis]
MAPRKRLLPAAATTALLVFSGYTLNVAVAAPALAADSAVTATATGAPSSAPGAPSAEPTAPTTLAPPADGTPAVTVATPAPAGAPAATAVPAAAPALALSSYDRATGEAVLTAAGGAAPESGTAPAAIKPGQLIDSPPTPAAPQGALVAVTDVKQASDGTVAVSTRPAALPELLGGANASLKAPVSPASLRVEPQVKDLKVAVDTGPTGGQGSVSGGLGLSADTTVPLPNGSSVRLSGSVSIDPTVSFSYQGGLGALAPQQARIGFDLGAHADWHVSGADLAGGASVKIPLAKLSASPVVMVGVLPVVINLDFKLSLDISADGTITVDAEQSYDGHWGVHSDYTSGQGWTTTTEPGTSTVSRCASTSAATPR